MEPGQVSLLRMQRIWNWVGRSKKDYLAIDPCFANQIDKAKIEEIPASLSQGLVLGDQRFKDQIQTITGQRTQLCKSGRKKTVSRCQEFLL